MKKKKPRASKAKLKDIFNAFAKKSVEDFPQLKDKFALYSVPTKSWHGKLAGGPAVDKLMDELIDDAIEGDGVHFAYRPSGYYLMAYVNDNKVRGMTSPSDSREQEVFAQLQHELGHLVAPGGNSSSHGDNFCECVADTFSFIRQKQQYGNIKEAIEATIQIATVDFILNEETLHFTAPALRALAEYAQQHDLSELTPKETAQLAYKISEQYAYSSKNLVQLEKIFAPVKEAHEKDLESALKKCRRIMQEDHGDLSDDVRDVGMTFLASFPAQNLRAKKTAKPKL